MDIKRMTRKTFWYYLIPLLILAVVMLSLAQTLIITLFDLFKNGFRFSVLAFQILCILATILLITVFIKRLVLFCKVFYYRAQIKRFHNEINMSNRCVMWDGAPGTGKTFTSIYLTCYQSLVLWEELITQYLLRMPFAAQYLEEYERGISNVWLTYKAVFDSVKFYNSNGYIPCCYANIKFVFQGKEPIPLSLQHFQQRKRFAEFNVKLIDEGAEILPNTMRTNNGFKDSLHINDINNYLSMFRQYDEGHMVINDQRGTELFKGARSVFNATNYLVEQRSIMSPALFIKILNFFIVRLKKRGYNASRVFSARLLALQKRIRQIGFRRFYYVCTLGAEGRMKNNKEILSYVLPCDPPFEYDDRARRHEYKAKDLPLM